MKTFSLVSAALLAAWLLTVGFPGRVASLVRLSLLHIFRWESNKVAHADNGRTPLINRISLGVFFGSFGRILFLLFVLVLSGLTTQGAAYASPAITYGTYVNGTYYGGGTPITYTSDPGGPNYTNQNLSSTGSATDPLDSNLYSSSTASLSNDELKLTLTGSPTYTQGYAEMWDTISASNLPTGPSISANTVVGTLSLNVTESIGTATYNNGGVAGFSLALYDPASFSVPTPITSQDCAFSVQYCNGYIIGNGIGAVSNSVFQGTSNSLSTNVSVTQGELQSGVAFIAEVDAQTYADSTLTAPFVIDPSITFSTPYSGLTLNSESGAHYMLSPVPEPGINAMFIAGLALLGFVVARKTKPQVS